MIAKELQLSLLNGLYVSIDMSQIIFLLVVVGYDLCINISEWLLFAKGSEPFSNYFEK